MYLLKPPDRRLIVRISKLKHPNNIKMTRLKTDTQITFSLHFTPLGIRLSAFVAQLSSLRNDHSRTFFNPLLKVSIRWIV